MVSSVGEIRRLLESEPFNRPNGPTNGSPHPSQHYHVSPSDSSDPFATVVILLILGISFIIIITVFICVRVCILGLAGDDEDDCQEPSQPSPSHVVPATIDAEPPTSAWM